MYKWSGNSFVKLQSLQTYGAYDVKSFSNNGETFLAFANSRNGNSYNIDSFIYKWNGSRFVLFQSIPTHGAIAWEPFAICDETFLAVANNKGNSVSVYRLSGSQFIKYQELSIQGPSDLKVFEYNGHTYLAITIHKDERSLFNTNSALYKTGQELNYSKPLKLSLGIHNATTIVTNTESTVTLSKADKVGRGASFHCDFHKSVIFQ